MSDATTPPPENKRLDVLAGTWSSYGRTVPTPAEPSVTITGSDVYAWLPGGHFLVHRVDVRIAGEPVEVIEMIGPYDPETGGYPARSFDSAGNFTTMRATVDDVGVWTFAGEAERAILTIGADGAGMTARWERAGEFGWEHWMDMTFTRSG